MVLPIGVAQLGTFKGAKGDKGSTGTFEQTSAVSVPADQPASAVIGGSPEYRTVTFYIPRGLPGAGGETTDAATAALIAAGDSDSRKALNGRFLGAWDRSQIVCLGDSITAGNQDVSGITYPGLIAAALPDSTVTTIGMSGWASADIAGLWGAPFIVGAFTVPAGTTETATTILAPVDGFRTTAPIYPSWTGVLTTPAGVQIPGVLKHTIAPESTVVNGWTFTRTTAGSSTAIPAGSKFVCNQFDHLKNATLVVGVGRNNDLSQPDVVARDVGAIIAAHRAPAEAVIVLPVPPSTNQGAPQAVFQNLLEVNRRTKATYPSQFVDDAAFMQWQGLPVNGMVPTSADLGNITYGSMPPALIQPDLVHPNQYGYRAKALAVLAGIRKRGAFGREQAIPGLVAGARPLRWAASDLAHPFSAKVLDWKDRFNANPLGSTVADAAPQVRADDVTGQRGVYFDPTSQAQYLLVTTGATIAPPYAVTFRLKVHSLAAASGLVFSGGSPGDSINIRPTTGRISVNGVESTVAVPLNEMVSGYIIVKADNTAEVWLMGVSQTITTTTYGLLGSFRVGYIYATPNPIGAAMTLYDLCVFPGQFTASTARSLLSLMVSGTI